MTYYETNPTNQIQLHGAVNRRFRIIYWNSNRIMPNHAILHQQVQRNNIYSRKNGTEMKVLMYLLVMAGIYLNLAYVIHDVLPHLNQWLTALNSSAVIACAFYLNQVFKEK